MTTQEAPRTFTGSPEFPVEFDDPADAELTWERDDMHMPFAMTPLAVDFHLEVIGSSFTPWYELFDAPQRLVPGAWHGWGYFSFRRNVPDDEVQAADERWTELHRGRIPITKALWNDEILPELRDIFALIAAIPIDELSGPDLAAAWDRAWTRCLRAWVLHFVTIMGPYQVLDDLIDAYTAAMGPGRETEAVGLVSGGHHELQEVEEGIEALAGLVVDDALRTGIEAAASEGSITEEVELGGLRALPGGEAFVDAIEIFLETHGHLGQNHDDLRLASWGEAPRLLLGRIATRLRSPAPPTREREAEQARRADELAAGVRAALGDKPDDLARFDDLLGHARDIAYLTEGHNYWIDRLSQARMRTLALRIGRRLVREGMLDDADDVFFLRRAEVTDALRDGTSRQELVRERRAEHAVNERRTAPYYVGRIPDKPSEGGRFDPARVTTAEPDSLKGVGASAGIVSGPARVTLSQEDFGRIQQGDIIVCPSSNPSWVPVFAIAGGLVTNTGGVLSHAAVVAREFGLPAVVGTGDATTKIRDGRLVEIDGTAGTVRLL